MYTVNVEKGRLLETLRQNLEVHKAEYAEAIENYPEVVAHELRKRASQIDAGNPVDLQFNLPKPQSFESEYGDAIQMLEWATDEVIELDQQQFKQYVQDEWHWQRAFAASTQMYNSR